MPLQENAAVQEPERTAGVTGRQSLTGGGPAPPYAVWLSILTVRRVAFFVRGRQFNLMSSTKWCCRSSNRCWRFASSPSLVAQLFEATGLMGSVRNPMAPKRQRIENAYRQPLIA
jgi:hypothetical protein